MKAQDIVNRGFHLDLTCFNWIRLVIRDPELPSTSLHLAHYLEMHMNSNHDVAWPSISRAIEETKYSRPTVIKAIRILEERGWIAKEKTRPHGGTLYQITTPKILESAVKEVNQSLLTGKPPLPVPVKEVNQCPVKEVNPNNNINNNINNNKDNKWPSDDVQPEKSLPREERSEKGLESFGDFWDLYPRRVKKDRAMRAWKRNRCDKIADEILGDVFYRIEKDPQWARSKELIPHPSTYINDRRWEDER